MPLWRQLLWVVLLLAVAGAGTYGWNLYAPAGEEPGGRGAEGARVVVTAPVERRALERRVEAVGTTRARQAVEVVPLASGRIEALLFEAGAVVPAGHVLARLDDDIERADLAEAEALLREQELALDRARTLKTSSAVSQATIDQLEAAVATARARVDRAARRLADRRIEAPFAGRVGLRKVDVGARVDDDTVIVTLDDLAEIEIAFELPEHLFGRVAIGQPVLATSAAFGDRTFDGMVRRVDTRIDPVARSFAVRAALPNPALELPAGMFMHLVLVVERRTALVVPEAAVVVEGDARALFVVEAGRAVRRAVELGQREPGLVEVRSGVHEGEAVIVQGLQRVRDGVPVAPAEVAPDGAPVAVPEPPVSSGSPA